MSVVSICPIPKGLTKQQENVYFKMAFQGYEFYCDNDIDNYKCWLFKANREVIKVDRRVALSLSKKEIIVPDITHDLKAHNTCRFKIKDNLKLSH